MSPMLRTRLTNIVQDLEQTNQRMSDALVGDIDDWTIGSIRTEFESVLRKLADQSRTIATLKATLTENWT